MGKVVNGIPPQPSQRPLCVSQFALANYACSRMPPSPASDIFFPHPHPHRRPRQHGHRHPPPGAHPSAVENCCRWLSDVDNECVCDLLIRLPIFLARPAHQFTIVIGDTCTITFSCSGRVRP
ncbi:hypothetical protein JCGZ_21960 [Jatropha curcas]|uniref:Bifunctional inhibitor/plant lipid transfer protein/seed storage helical domain-containing protein n=1 Tax=Jatropha curcas TaxID=180498 RepID=A0A067JPM6_JATCU|nr:hypothetical protein JCGZ_21960 [Jatropha curcas]